MIKYPVRVVLRSSSDHVELIPEIEDYIPQNEFYSEKGWPCEHFSYCRYQLNIGILPETENHIRDNKITVEEFIKLYGYDFITLGLVTNSDIPYLRCHYDTMGHSYPCGRQWCVTPENTYSSLDRSERDKKYPIVAYGIAAVFAWNLDFDNKINDFVLPCSDEQLARLYYSRGLAIFLESYSGRSTNSLSAYEKEEKFLQMSIANEKNYGTLNNLDQFPLLKEYTDQYVSYYALYLDNKMMEVKSKIKESIHPKVFVSYSHDSKEHKSWVLKLSSDLRSHGVDVILDQWDLRLGDDLPFFMEQGLSSSSMILCVCSDQYVTKANAGKGGAGYEKKILAAELMKDVECNYVIPIMRNTSEKHLPTFLAGTKYLDFTGDDYIGPYSELLTRIYDEDIKAKPALGTNPFRDSTISGTIDTIVNIQRVDFSNPNLEGIIVFDYIRNSGKFQIGNGDYIFDTKWSQCGESSIYCYSDDVRRIGYNTEVKNLPSELPNIKDFDFTSRSWQVFSGQIVILENKNGKIAALKVIDVKKPVQGKGASLTFEYKIYTY